MSQQAHARKNRVIAFLVMGIFGLCTTGATVVFGSQLINVAAYALGYGEPMQVVVTESSRADASIFRGDPGLARIATGDELIHVYGARTGEVLTARPRLINIGAAPYAYHGPGSAAVDLLYLIPTAMFGFPLALLLLSVIAPDRVRRFIDRKKP